MKKEKLLKFLYIAYGIVNSAFWGIYQMDSLWLLVTGDRRHVTGDMWQVTYVMWPVICYMWHVTCHMWLVKCDMWYVTCNMWHVTFDIWHFTHDIWHMTHDTWHKVIVFISIFFSLVVLFLFFFPPSPLSPSLFCI